MCLVLWEVSVFSSSRLCTPRGAPQLASLWLQNPNRPPLFCSHRGRKFLPWCPNAPKHVQVFSLLCAVFQALLAELPVQVSLFISTYFPWHQSSRSLPRAPALQAWLARKAVNSSLLGTTAPRRHLILLRPGNEACWLRHIVRKASSLLESSE